MTPARTNCQKLTSSHYHCDAPCSKRFVQKLMQRRLATSCVAITAVDSFAMPRPTAPRLQHMSRDGRNVARIMLKYRRESYQRTAQYLSHAPD